MPPLPSSYIIDFDHSPFPSFVSFPLLSVFVFSAGPTVHIVFWGVSSVSLIRIAYRSAGTLSVALPLKKNITPPPATSHKLYLLKEGWGPMNFSSFASCYLPVGVVLLLRVSSSLYIVGTASLLCTHFISVSYLFLLLSLKHICF